MVEKVHCIPVAILFLRYIYNDIWTSPCHDSMSLDELSWKSARYLSEKSAVRIRHWGCRSRIARIAQLV